MNDLNYYASLLAEQHHLKARLDYELDLEILNLPQTQKQKIQRWDYLYSLAFRILMIEGLLNQWAERAEFDLNAICERN